MKIQSVKTQRLLTNRKHDTIPLEQPTSPVHVASGIIRLPS